MIFLITTYYKIEYYFEYCKYIFIYYEFIKCILLLLYVLFYVLLYSYQKVKKRDSDIINKMRCWGIYPKAEHEKAMRNVVNIILILVFIQVARTGLRNLIFDKANNAVLEAIPYPEALIKVLKEDYFIIYEKQGLFDDLPIEYYFDGKSLGPVIMIGNDPYDTIHGLGDNFLVKGKVEEKYKKVIDDTVIRVDTWDIIYPITRGYVDEFDHRYIYPISFVDNYDVERGDYPLDIEKNKPEQLSFFEVEYYLNYENGYLLVAPKKEDGEIHWYLCENGVPMGIESVPVHQIRLSENMQDTQSSQLWDDEAVEDEMLWYKNNLILIKGEYEGDTFQVESWDFVFHW